MLSKLPRKVYWPKLKTVSSFTTRGNNAQWNVDTLRGRGILAGQYIHVVGNARQDIQERTVYPVVATRARVTLNLLVHNGNMLTVSSLIISEDHLHGRCTCHN